MLQPQLRKQDEKLCAPVWIQVTTLIQIHQSYEAVFYFARKVRYCDYSTSIRTHTRLTTFDIRFVSVQIILNLRIQQYNIITYVLSQKFETKFKVVSCNTQCSGSLNMNSSALFQCFYSDVLGCQHKFFGLVSKNSANVLHCKLSVVGQTAEISAKNSEGNTTPQHNTFE